MRYKMLGAGLALVMALALPCVAQDGATASPSPPAGPVDSGVVTVDGHAVEAHYYTDGDKTWFPVIDVLKVDGKTATFDSGSNQLTVDGKVVPADVIVLNGAPYVRLKDLREIQPTMNLQNLGNGKAIFNHVVKISSSSPLTNFLLVNQDSPGQPIDISNFKVKGKYTVCDLYSQYCPPCRRWGSALQQLALKATNLAVREFDINRPGVREIDFQSPLAKQYKLDSVPYMVIYDPDGKMVSDDLQKSVNMICHWFNQRGVSDDQLRKAGLIQ